VEFQGDLWPGRASSPAVSDGIAYIKLYDTLYALDSQTGRLIWSKPTLSSDHSSPAVAYDMVFDSTGNYPDCPGCGVVAYDAKTGDEKWRMNLLLGARGPNVYKNVVYFGSDDHYVRAVNAYTGDLLWTSPYLNDGVTAVPAVANGKVFVGTWTNKLYALDVNTGTKVWEFRPDIGGVMFSSPSVINSTIYMGTGLDRLLAIENIDTETPTIKWISQLTEDTIGSSAAVAYGTVYFISDAGTVYALNSDTGSLIWSYRTNPSTRPSHSSPAVSNGVVYIGSQDKYIYAFDAFTGAVLWKYETGGVIDSSPAIADGMVFVGSNDAKIYAFGIETPATPTPTPIPTTKVVVAPGFGASWNADAILNCKTDGYSGDWTLAPYAKSIYQPLLNSLSSAGWTTLPFYYDWRKQVTENGNKFSDFINANVNPNEKVDLVGHSMGGLVERAYLESQGNSKVDSYYSAGSPHKGVVMAYPAWSGGDVWSDNILTSIATILLLHRCPNFSQNPRQMIQNIIPSTQNVLPTFDYLKNFQSGLLKPVSSMLAQNNWLPGDESLIFTGVRTGTLSGNGFQTLKYISVRNPSTTDKSKGNWLDGKPISREKASNGDGTVLTDSSQLGIADINDVINQNHSGLVSSSEGIGKILDFLGGVSPLLTISPLNPQNQHQKSEKQNSILIIIGYPASFWVSGPKTEALKDTDGMVSIDNPKQGHYKLILLPKTPKTLFIVMQVLPDGRTLYKEYNFSNYLPKFKTIKLDFDRPSEDILE